MQKKSQLQNWAVNSKMGKFGNFVSKDLCSPKNDRKVYTFLESPWLETQKNQIPTACKKNSRSSKMG